MEKKSEKKVKNEIDQVYLKRDRFFLLKNPTVKKLHKILKWANSCALFSQVTFLDCTQSFRRLHSDKNLLEELNKIVRVNKPDLKILVLDSLTGNDILEQIEKFGKVGFDGLILTKVDVNEKGGAILSVKQKTDKPILFLGTGQEYEDLEKFDAEKIVKKILE